MNFEDITNQLIKIGNGTVSFIVGLFAFFFFKLLFMVPINIIIRIAVDSKKIGVVSLMQSLSAVFIFVSIYLAYKYTKKLNANGNKKSRIIKRILTIIIGLISLILTVVILKLPIVY